MINAILRVYVLLDNQDGGVGQGQVFDSDAGCCGVFGGFDHLKRDFFSLCVVDEGNGLGGDPGRQVEFNACVLQRREFVGGVVDQVIGIDQCDKGGVPRGEQGDVELVRRGGVCIGRFASQQVIAVVLQEVVPVFDRLGGGGVLFYAFFAEGEPQDALGPA